MQTIAQALGLGRRSQYRVQLETATETYRGAKAALAAETRKIEGPSMLEQAMQRDELAAAEALEECEPRFPHN
jgi:hypothetical protein